MTILLAAGAVSLAAVVPAAAQTQYPYPYPQQTYPQQGYPQPGYPQPGYGYPPQGQGGMGQIIDQLLGNRYAANDRYAVERCATAAVAQATEQYRGNQYSQGYGDPNQGYGNPNQGYGGPNQGYGDPNQVFGNPDRRYNRARTMRVTAITEVQRRQNGLRISGLLDSRGGYQRYGQGYGQPYGQAPGYQNQGYAAQGDLTFRCNVDYRGTVTNVRIRRNTAAYNRGY
jgi:hypothetical protein